MTNKEARELLLTVVGDLEEMSRKVAASGRLNAEAEAATWRVAASHVRHTALNKFSECLEGAR